MPLIITHGWPGSVIEQLKVIGPLTNPTAHGGRAEDAFDVVIPSMPGYGFSGRPTDTGWDPDRIARAWAELMKRLGYTHYVAQGGDWGSPVSSAMARQAPPGLLGIHINLPATVPPEVAAVLAAAGPRRRDSPKRNARRSTRSSTFNKKEQGLRRDDGHAAADDRLRLDGFPGGPRGVDAHTTTAWTYSGEPDASLTKDEVLDDITLYWLTNTATSRRGCTGRPAANFFLRPRRRPPRSRSRWPSRYFRGRSIARRRPGPGAPIAT